LYIVLGELFDASILKWNVVLVKYSNKIETKKAWKKFKIKIASDGDLVSVGKKKFFIYRSVSEEPTQIILASRSKKALDYLITKNFKKDKNIKIEEKEYSFNLIWVIIV